MYQNNNEDTIKINNKTNIFSNVFAKENIGLYIVSLMVSLVGTNAEFSIFSISLLGSAFASGVPLLGIIIISLIRKYNKIWSIRWFRIFFNIISINSKFINNKTKI